ncbi:hypothetical protein N1851_009578 [Merluccius polli]|uniref:Uncharacterized protein n=1 Tax=Merluccius polli TaxID=89951 RepID=A0AA47N0Y3_MERPO|nr:hypothetical protein N1851_009578 [Merluccius polli]
MAEVWGGFVHNGKQDLPAGSGLRISPETLTTDNRLQFSGMAFATFAESYGFHYITSHHSGIIRGSYTVKTVNDLLKKAADPYLTLLAYRATPLQQQYNQCVECVWLIAGLQPHPAPDSNQSDLGQQAPTRRASTGDQPERTGTVIGNHTTPRSYGPHGTVRRNRHHLIPMQASLEQSSGGEEEQNLVVQNRVLLHKNHRISRMFLVRHLLLGPEVWESCGETN